MQGRAISSAALPQYTAYSSIAYKGRDLRLRPTTLAKAFALFLVVGVVTTPVMYVADIGLSRYIALWCWQLGRLVCSYTDMSFVVAGYPMLVCGRCFGGTLGMVAVAFLYTRHIRPRLPYRRLHRAALIGLFLTPWLIDSGLERLHLYVTTMWLIVPTGFLGGVALALAPLIFWPRDDPDDC